MVYAQLFCKPFSKILHASTPPALSLTTQPPLSSLSQQTPLPFVSLAQQPPPTVVVSLAEHPPSLPSPSYSNPCPFRLSRTETLVPSVSLTQQPFQSSSASVTLEIFVCFALSDVLVRQVTMVAFGLVVARDCDDLWVLVVLGFD